MQKSIADNFDEELLSKLDMYSVRKEDVKAAFPCDLKDAFSYGRNTILATEDEVCIFGENGAFFKKKFAEIKDVFAENYVSSGAIILKCENEDIPVGFFTLTKAAEAERFITSLRKLMVGEDVNEEEKTLPEERFSYINQGRKKLFFRVLSYVLRYKIQLFAMMAVIALQTLSAMLLPYISGTVLYDEVLSKSGRYSGCIAQTVCVLIIINAFSVLLGIFQGRIGADISGKIVYEIKTEVFSAMQNLSMSFFSSKRTGNLLNRVNSDALDIQYFLNDGLPNFIINVLTICAVGLYLFIVNPILSIAVLIPVPLIALIIKKSARKFKKLKWHTWRKSSAMNSVINDTLAGIRVVKAFGKEENEIERFSDTSRQLYENRVREGFAAAKVFPFLTWIMSLGSLAVWAIGGSQVMCGSLTFGELMSFVGYLSLLYNPVNFMMKTFDWWTSCMNSAQRIFEITDTKTDLPEAEDAVNKERLRGNVSLKNVTFSYEPNRTVLKNVSFDIKEGEMIGLVGHSGAGKSTITNIITRLYDVKDGEVLIDGINVKKLSRETLRKNIAMVLQETFLFSASVAKNIAYGKPSATKEEIVQAAKEAHAHEFIVNLPDGYDTVIGARGTDLSGGEKQRISIARALLTNPAILIFDEATASLDTKTEEKIQDAMKTLVKGRTTIAIAHRLSTLKNVDRLIVVENGEIVETGTHKELFEKENGVYSNMAHKQLEALEELNVR